MEPWYKVATPGKEVREGRSFNPDEFAVALEQVVSARGPGDYCNPIQFSHGHVSQALSKIFSNPRISRTHPSRAMESIRHQTHR
jgi:hypothetical protein